MKAYSYMPLLYPPQHRQMTKGLQDLICKPLFCMVRPKRFELLTPWFVAKYSIQLSYGRVRRELYANLGLFPVEKTNLAINVQCLAESEGFEPSIQI